MKIRFLTYHQTAECPISSDVHVVEQSEFEKQIDLLCHSGIQIADAYMLYRNDVLPTYSVCVTFDDGSESDIANARYLKKRGINGMFFISTARIGLPGYLTQSQILEMHDLGMLIGSHSHEHKALDLLPLGEARVQMATSKKQLEDLLGQTVDHLAFPGGGHNRDVVKAAYDIGYRFVFSTIWGVNHIRDSSPAVLRRDTVVRGMSLEDYQAMVIGNKEWARRATYYCKQAAHKLLPRSGYQAIRRRFIDG